MQARVQHAESFDSPKGWLVGFESRWRQYLMLFSQNLNYLHLDYNMNLKPVK